MKKSSSGDKGAMYALIGGSIDDARKVCSSLSTYGSCEIANDNGGGQTILSGSKKAFKKIDIVIKDSKVKKAMLLPVDIAFHSKFMKEAATIMQEELQKYFFQKPKVDVIANYSVTKHTSDDVTKNLLIKQIEGKVRWREIIAKMYKFKIRRFIEIGPGKVLSNLIKRDYTDVKVYSLQCIKDIEDYLKQRKTQN